MDNNLKEVLTLYAPIVSAIISAVVLYLQSRQRRVIEAVASDVLRVEKATNSMKDQLVATTRSAAHGEGKEQERLEQLARDAQYAGGMKAAVEQGAASTQVKAAETQVKAAETQAAAAEKVAEVREKAGPPQGSNTP